MCDGRKLLLVHIILIVIGVIVYISGMCVAVSLGVVLFKKASSFKGRCICAVQHMNYITFNISRSSCKEVVSDSASDLSGHYNPVPHCMAGNDWIYQQ